MHRVHRQLGMIATLALASLVASGCGESVQDAEQALCADLSTLNASVTTLAALNADSSVAEFKQAAQNVRSSWRDVEDSANNLGDSRFDHVKDSWDDFKDEIDDVDDQDSLAEALTEIRDAAATFEASESKIVSGLNCTSSN